MRSGTYVGKFSFQGPVQRGLNRKMVLFWLIIICMPPRSSALPSPSSTSSRSSRRRP